MAHELDGLAYEEQAKARGTTKRICFFVVMIISFTVSVLIRKYL